MGIEIRNYKLSDSAVALLTVRAVEHNAGPVVGGPAKWLVPPHQACGGDHSALTAPHTLRKLLHMNMLSASKLLKCGG